MLDSPCECWHRIMPNECARLPLMAWVAKIAIKAQERSRRGGKTRLKCPGFAVGVPQDNGKTDEGHFWWTSGPNHAPDHLSE
jgi:hypothetical protein